MTETCRIRMNRKREPIASAGKVTGFAGAGEKKPIAALRG